MRGLEEIRVINENPKLHAASRDEATARRIVNGEVTRERLTAAQAFHGQRAAAKRAANRAEVR